MAVLLYQLGIFIAIQIAASFGKSSRNTAIVLISIFTILQVFMSWLLLLQFITIIISYNISNNLFFSKSKFNPEPKPSKVILKSYAENGARVYQEYDENDPNLNPETKRKIELQKEIQQRSSESYNNDPEIQKAVDAIIEDVRKRANNK